MAAQEFTDLQRKKITETAYGKTVWKMNKEIKIDDGKPIQQGSKGIIYQKDREPSKSPG